MGGLNSSEKRMRLLVTGLGGFVGQNLVSLAERDGSVLAPYDIVTALPVYDLLDPKSLDAVIESAAPSAVIHLAAQSFVPASFDDPLNTFDVNVKGTFNLLNALKKHGFDGKFLYVSSGDVYGQISENDLPISETQLVKPRNPYAVSKCCAELLCYQWACTEGLAAVIARPFNHIGIGQKPSFVIPSLARQIARIKLGLQAPEIIAGDISVSRDFLAVEDVLRAYIALLKHGVTGEVYNVCAGREYVIEELAARMCDIAQVEVEWKLDRSRLRRNEQRRVVGSNKKLTKDTGWVSNVSIDEILTTILADWERREKSNV